MRRLYITIAVGTIAVGTIAVSTITVGTVTVGTITVVQLLSIVHLLLRSLRRRRFITLLRNWT